MRYNIRMSNPVPAACLVLSLVLPMLSQAQLRWPAEEIKVWVALKDKGPGAGALARTSRRYENLAVHEPAWRPCGPGVSPARPGSNGRTWSPGASIRPRFPAS